MSLRLIVSGIDKYYNGKPILEACSYDFQPVGIYALMGPNGCGKSTFLRICALLEQPDKGLVRFFSGNSEVARSIALRRRITLVLPKVGVFNTTVFKNVASGLDIRGIGGSIAREKTEQALSFVGLYHLRNQNAHTLSSGETQRLGIARALAIDPEILFLDEPTASVDRESTAIIEQIVTRLHEEQGRTIILTTHDAAQAERLTDRMLTVTDRRIKDTSGDRDPAGAEDENRISSRL